jgi:N-acetylglucosaminyldiphosphoundecaprenol N-acetyl-beta-D-mannosaminyltransferase
LNPIVAAEPTVAAPQHVARRRASFLDCPFDSMTEMEALDQCLAWCDEPRTSHMLVTVNVSILMMMRSDPRLRAACLDSEVVVADGVPIVWATRLLGSPLAARVCGCDLMACLLDLEREQPLRVFFLGAREEVVTKLAEQVEQYCTGIIVAGYRNGYFSTEDHGDIVRQIRDSRADILFVGMPTPFKETFCHAHRDELCTPVILGVGGSFDVLAGFVTRAPKWMQRSGLEWFWRLMMEPRKMWRRYLVTNTQFLFLLARAMAATRFKRGHECPTMTHPHVES